MASILETTELTKYFRDQWTWRRFCALDRLSLQIEEGEIFGLIGPNGAGKTTTFKVLLGLLRASEGTIRFQGRTLDSAARVAIGFLPEQPYFYDHLTVQEILDFYARLHGLAAAARRQRIADVIEQVQVGPKRSAPLRTLSKGTLQRVGVAQAIINKPRLVILDEPMSGLDPAGRHHMRELILSLCGAGTTVIFSSHILPDAETLCTRVGILVHGRLREVVSVGGTSDQQLYVIAVSNVPSSCLAEIEKIAGSPGSMNGGGWSFRLRDYAAVRAALEVLRQTSGIVHSLTPVQASLEERFLAHTGHVAQFD